MSIEKLICGKKIVIYGNGNTGKEFYNKYKDILDIEGCTCSDREIIPIPGLKAVRCHEIDKGNCLIIICSIFYEEIRKKLIMLDFKQNIDFVRWDIFELLFQINTNNKQLVVAVGQCEIREICTVFNRIQSFKNKYEIIYFDERKVCNHGDKFDILECYDCMFVLGKADIFIRPSVMAPKSTESFGYLQDRTNRKCKTIKVSLFIFDSYWPQDIANDREISKYYMIRPNTKLAAFVESERVIESMLDAGKSNDQIKKEILKEDFFDNELVIGNHQTALKRIRIADKLSDIKIYDYVEKNYNKIKLFCDRGHFSENMLDEYVKRIFAYLNEDACVQELNQIDISDIMEKVNELPIYPSTAKILNLHWIDRNTIYRMNINNKIKKVTIDEYIETMLEYYSEVRKLVKLYY